MPTRARSARTRVRRLPKRGVYERGTIAAILDEGVVGHIGFVHDGQPAVIPTLYARVEDLVYIHGSAASRMLRTLTGGADFCLTVTLLDGLVLARSAFHHSANYRSVVVFGRARLVADRTEKLAALEAFAEQIVPGRWAEVRPPNARELKATTVLALPLTEASAKIRSGPPSDGRRTTPFPSGPALSRCASSPARRSPTRHSRRVSPSPLTPATTAATPPRAMARSQWTERERAKGMRCRREASFRRSRWTSR